VPLGAHTSWSADCSHPWSKKQKEKVCLRGAERPFLFREGNDQAKNDSVKTLSTRKKWRRKKTQKE
jgi:hypothetical protein